MRVIAGKTGAAFILAIVPLSPRTRLVVLSYPHDGFALIATPSSGHVELRVEDICDAIGLSQAEAKLAKALVSGASLKEDAEAAGLSLNTARRPLAAAFLKTETNKQSDLVSLLVRAIGIISAD
jgi:DNA-binding CsgD family transcriptional regulator